MTELGNEKMTTESLTEIKNLVTDIKENMMSEKNCNDQLYTIIQTLDGIGNYISRLEQNEEPKSGEFTVLQTNLLEVRNEIARLNQSIDSTNLAEFEPLVTKLTEKVNRLDIIANNSGIDKQILLNISAQLEQNLGTKLNENAEVLYNQSNTATNLVKTDIETLNENLKDGIQYLEKIFKTKVENSNESNVSSISDDILLLSTNIEKSNANLKKSVIDIFSKIQENINSISFSKVAGVGGINVEALQENLEMLKNGLYNLNVNTTQQYNKILETISETPEVEEKEDTTKEEIHSKVNELLPFTKDSVKDIKDLICELKQNISYLQSSDEDSDYTYSMQDIESDLAKIRIYLNELGQHINTLALNNNNEELNNIYITLDKINQRVQKDENFEVTDNIKKMQEDILSISTRVNTLLLSSDKDTETLNTSLDKFQNCFEKINSQLKSETNARQYSNIESALEQINKVLDDNKSYNELINQSLVMLAEWVDNAGESLTNISDRLGNGIDSIQIPETIDYSAKIEALEQKILEQNAQIAQQQEYISSMDEKLAVILNQNQQIASLEERLKQMDERMTTILEFSAKNDASVVMDKMTNIDAKLEKLNNSIGKLTSYVDEE